MGRSTAGRAFIGLLIIVGVGAAGWFGTRAAQGAFAEDYRFTVEVGRTGQGLVSGSDVAARGVLIGKVGDISLNDELRAEVELILEPEYQIPSDARFAIVGKTLFGEKQLEVLYPGDFDTAPNYIAYGDTIRPESGQIVEVQDVLEDLDNLFGAIDPIDLATVVNDGVGAFVGQENNIGRAIDQGARATGVFAGTLDDAVPALSDLSLVAESLGPVGDEFNRLGSGIDGGALDTLTVNQQRLRILLTELNRFSDQLDIVLELTRPDLDKLMLEGDNVTRMLFAYRPELGDLVEGIDDYSDTIGNGGLSDPGFSGLAAAFQIILENPVTHEVCAGLPPEIGGALPLCAEGAEAAAAAPTPALPAASVVEVPVLVDTAPELPLRGDLTDVFGQVLGDLGLLRGGAQ